MKIEAAVFDLGDVVVKANEDLLRKDIKQTLRLDDRKLRDILKVIASDMQTGVLTEDGLIEKLKIEFGPSVDIPNDLFERSFRNNFKMIDGTQNVIESIRKKGIPTACLSNTIPSHVQVMRENGVFDLFDVEVLSCEVGMRKPDPKIFQLAIAKLDKNPSETFYTDDRPKFVAAARNIGFEAVIFENPDQLRTDLGKLGLVA